MASTLDAGAATIERIDTARWTGTGVYVSQQSDTASSGNVIKRKVYYKNEFGSTDAFGTWTLIHEFADDTSYATALAYINDTIIAGQTNGTAPASLVMTWEDVTGFTGLLDDYPGAAAAYSLRRLDTTYTGSAIRVRRASDNAEQDIGFDNNELDTSALATFCSGTNGFVKTWYDQSGNANNATQTSTSAQPKIYDSSTGVVTENSLPALQGSSTCTINIASSIIGAGNYSIYTAHTYSEADMLYGGAVPTFGIWDINGDILQRFDDGTNVALTASYVNGDRILSYQNRASGAWEIAANGGTPATGTTTASLTIDRLFTGFGGTTYSFAGKVQEFIFYESDQSSNRSGIETNINDFYSIYP